MSVASIRESDYLAGLLVYLRRRQSVISQVLRQLLYILMSVPLLVVYAVTLVDQLINDPHWWDSGSFIAFFAEFSSELEYLFPLILIYLAFFFAALAIEKCALAKPQSTIGSAGRSILIFAACAVGVALLLLAVFSSWSLYILRFGQIELGTAWLITYFLTLAVTLALMLIAYTREVRRRTWNAACRESLMQCGILAFVAFVISVTFATAMDFAAPSAQATQALNIGSTASWSGAGLCAVVVLFTANITVWSADSGR